MAPHPRPCRAARAHPYRSGRAACAYPCRPLRRPCPSLLAAAPPVPVLASRRTVRPCRPPPIHADCHLVRAVAPTVTSSTPAVTSSRPAGRAGCHHVHAGRHLVHIHAGRHLILNLDNFYTKLNKQLASFTESSRVPILDSTVERAEPSSFVC